MKTSDDVVETGAGAARAGTVSFTEEPINETRAARTGRARTSADDVSFPRARDTRARKRKRSIGGTEERRERWSELNDDDDDDEGP